MPPPPKTHDAGQRPDEGPLSTMEAEFIERCLDALRQHVQLGDATRVLPFETAAAGADALLELNVGGKTHRFLVEVKRHLREPAVAHAVHQVLQYEGVDAHPILCADRVPEEWGKRVRDAGVGYLDLGGNASLEAEGLTILISGRPAVEVSKGLALRGTEVRLLGVFLREQDAGATIQQDLATRAGIALGAVGRARKQLEKMGLLARVGKKAWKIQDRSRALDRFAEGWASSIRPKLHPVRYRPLGRSLSADELATALASVDGGEQCLVGGEAGAAIYTGELRTEHATLHVPADLRRALVRELRLARDDTGPITLLDRYGTGDAFEDADGPPLAHPLLVWAECTTVVDERVIHANRRLRETQLVE